MFKELTMLKSECVYTVIIFDILNFSMCTFIQCLHSQTNFFFEYIYIKHTYNLHHTYHNNYVPVCHQCILEKVYLYSVTIIISYIMKYI